MATTEIVHYIAEGFTHNEITIGVFVDLSKAFDTVNHILLQTLVIMESVVLPSIGYEAIYLTEIKSYFKT